MLKTILFAGLISLMVVLPPRQVGTVEPLTAIAAIASLFATFTGFLDTGADPTATEVSQIRIMLTNLHERLQNYDTALLRVMEKLDDLPSIMQEELKRAFDQDQAYALLAAIRLIIEDVRVIEKGKLPIADAQLRLQSLQQASRDMMGRRDFNLPYIIAAMRTEHAFIWALGALEGARRDADWQVRMEGYRSWLEDLYSGPGSLVTKSSQLSREVAGAIEQYLKDWQVAMDEASDTQMSVVFPSQNGPNKIQPYCSAQSSKDMANRQISKYETDFYKVKILAVTSRLFLYMAVYAKYTVDTMTGEVKRHAPKPPEDPHRIYSSLDADWQRQLKRYESHEKRIRDEVLGRCVEKIRCHEALFRECFTAWLNGNDLKSIYGCHTIEERPDAWILNVQEGQFC